MNAPKHIMPPREPRATLRPALSMAEDAKRCNAALRRVLGDGNHQSTEAKQKLAREVEQRRKARRAAILEQLQQGPQTVSQLMASCHIADHAARESLLDLQASGLAMKQKGVMRNGRAVWALAENADVLG